jgi:hypothetical protein
VFLLFVVLSLFLFTIFMEPTYYNWGPLCKILWSVDRADGTHNRSENCRGARVAFHAHPAHNRSFSYNLSYYSFFTSCFHSISCFHVLHIHSSATFSKMN